MGAAWNEREHAAFGVRFPPISERFELLERVNRLADAGAQGLLFVLPRAADSDSIERFGTEVISAWP